MRMIAGRIVALAMLSITTLSFAQSQAGQIAHEPVYRAPFDLKLHIDKKHYYEQHFDKVPFVIDNDVYLFVGENFGVNVTIVDNQITGLTYQPNSNKSDIGFEFMQEKLNKDEMMMMLVTHNGLKLRLLFDALMTIPDKKGILKTSIIPIEPGLSNFESWPHPIVQLVLRNFRFVESSPAAPHN
ncbi:MAG: hypothetical protein WAN35_01195 [Terracidiphilus sp.]